MKNNAAFQEKKNFYINNGISTDWADIFFGGSAPVQQYDLNVSGGTDAVNYYFAFGHYDADGIMDDSICVVKPCVPTWNRTSTNG